MSIKRVLGIVVMLLCASGSGLTYDKSYQEKWAKRLDDVTQNFLLLHNVKELTNSFEFPVFTNEDIDNFLESEFGDFYSGFHTDIAHYAQFLAKRPKSQLKIWFTIINQFYKENTSLKNNVFANVVASRLEFPQFSTDDTWLIPHVISLTYGNKSDFYVDYRLQVFNNYSYRFEHFKALNNTGIITVHALACCVLGSATITRIPDFREKNYWQLYPDIQSDHRDFYALMLASAFIYNEINLKQKRFYEIEPKTKYITAESKHAQHLDYLSKYFKFSLREIVLINRKFYSHVIPPNQAFRLPHQLTVNFLANEEELAIGSAYMIHGIKSPFCLVKYGVKINDDIQGITANFSTSTSDIQKINFLTSNELTSNQRIFIKVPLKDSIFFSAFDTLSHVQIQAQIKARADEMSNWLEDCRPIKPVNTNNTASQRTHVVKSGETLSHIARKYSISVKQIKDWNNLKSDNIQIGQKLIIKK